MQCPKFADSQANGAFTVELEDYIKDSGIDYWIYGHSHYNVDVEIGNTKCVSNQLMSFMGSISHLTHVKISKYNTTCMNFAYNKMVRNLLWLKRKIISSESQQSQKNPIQRNKKRYSSETNKNMRF